MISDPIGSIATSLGAAGLGPAGNAAPVTAELASSGSDSQRFAAMLPPEQSAAPQPAAPGEAPVVRLTGPGGSSLGDAVLNSLQRFGRSVQSLDAVGKWPTPSASSASLPRGPAATALAAPSEPAPTEPAHHFDAEVKAASEDMQNLFSQGMTAQAKMYGAAFELGFVESSAESTNKSLKTLLTQGGG